jgi:hypothetical protein
LATAAPDGGVMSQITPFTYITVQHTEAQREGAIDKERQLRKAADQEKDIAAHDDMFEHQVESSEEIQAVGDDSEKQKQRKNRQDKKTGHGAAEADEENPHIDLTA